MSVALSPVSPRTRSVGAAEDPYKKYWLAILIGFVLTGAWLCLPVMETSVGSTHVDTAKPALDPNASQSLDNLANPNGAPGLNLSMDGIASHKSKSDQPVEDMLYAAPADAPGAAASGAPLGAASGSASGTLAQALKDVGDKKGGWGEKAQRGFDAPHLSGNGLSGAGSASGGSGASASSNVSAFGANVASVGYGGTKGLHEDGSVDKAAAAGSVAALRKIAAASQAAAVNRSGDGAAHGAGRMFDGSKGQGAIAVQGGNGIAANYEALDAAPANLKGNDPKLNQKELKEPPATNVPQSASSDNGKQMMMMLASVAVAGMLPGAAGGVVMMMAQQMMQQQEAAAAEQRSQDQINKLKQQQHIPSS